MRFDSLVTMADKVLMYKHIVKNVCYQNGYTATFMPKPLFGDNGSGMHTHQSLWKDGVPLFYDKDGYALLSDTARWYIGGLLEHAPAILAFAAPTTNSYRRLVPGYEAPIKLAYSARNRSACIRIPTYSAAPAARRLEFRSPDPMCNPYLSFSACLMAGLDGVKRRIEPPKPVEADLYELEGEEKARVKDLPGSLTEVLNALEVDNDFLTEGGVFTQDLIDMYISYKRENEVDPVALRPHPYEFAPLLRRLSFGSDLLSTLLPGQGAGLRRPAPLSYSGPERHGPRVEPPGAGRYSAGASAGRRTRWPPGRPSPPR